MEWMMDSVTITCKLPVRGYQNPRAVTCDSRATEWGGAGQNLAVNLIRERRNPFISTNGQFCDFGLLLDSGPSVTTVAVSPGVSVMQPSTHHLFSIIYIHKNKETYGNRGAGDMVTPDREISTNPA